MLGQVWYLIVFIPDLCTLTYFVTKKMALQLQVTKAEENTQTKMKSDAAVVKKIKNSTKPTIL